MTTADVMESRPAPGLKVGDLVEVLSAEEISATLDARGELDAPFHTGDARLLRPAPHRAQGRAQAGATTSGRPAFAGWRLPCTSPRPVATGPSTAAARTPARCTGRSSGSSAWRRGTLRRRWIDAGSRMLLPLLVANTTSEPFEDGATRWSCQATEMQRAAPQKSCRSRTLPSTETTSRPEFADVGAVVVAFLVGGLQPLPEAHSAVPSTGPPLPRRSGLGAS